MKIVSILILSVVLALSGMAVAQEDTTPPTEAPPTETTVPDDETDPEDGEDEPVPVWVWVLSGAALVALGGVAFRPRRPRGPQVAPAPAPVSPPRPAPVVDADKKADAYAEGRWLLDRLTVDLATFKADVDAGRVQSPPDTDSRSQALAALGERSIAVSTSMYQLEASASTDDARQVARAGASASESLRSAFDGLVAAGGGDPQAVGQLETARQVLGASLESIRNL